MGSIVTNITEIIFTTSIVGLIVGLGVLIYRTRHTRDLDSIVNKLAAYARDHPLVAVMLMASVALSIVSFWNTWSGMTRVLGNPITAFIATVGIQGLMLVFAWKIGFDMFGRNGASARASIVFGFCAYAAAMTVSVGFGAVRMFNVMFPDSERALWSEIRTEGEIRGILGQLFELNQERLSEQRILMEDANTGWPTVQNNLGSVSARSEQLRAEREAEAQAELERQQLAAAEDLAAATSLADAELQVRFKDQEIQQQRDLIALEQAYLDEWEEEFGENRREVARYDALIKSEIAGERTSGVPTCGPICEGLQEERRTYIIETGYDSGPLQEYNRINDALDTARETIRRLETEKRQLDRALQRLQLREQFRERSEANRANNPQQRDLTADLARIREVGSLIDLATAFITNPTRNDYEILRSQCEVIESEGPAVPGGEQLQCGLTPIEADALYLADLNEGRERLNEQCNIDEVDLTAVEKRVLFVTDYATRCLTLSGLKATDTAEFRRDIIEIKRNRSEDSPVFSLIQVALSDGEKLAWMAVILALLIDILVLLAALIGVLVDVDPMQGAGLRRGESIAIRQALIASQIMTAKQLAAYILASKAGPSIDAPGYTKLNLAGMDAKGRPLADGVIGAADSAQYQIDHRGGERLVSFCTATAISMMVMLLTPFHPRTILILGIMAGLISALIIPRFLDYRRRRQEPREASNEFEERIEKAKTLPGLVYISRPKSASNGEQDESAVEPVIAISGKMMQALQRVANETETHSQRLRRKIEERHKAERLRNKGRARGRNGSKYFAEDEGHKKPNRSKDPEVVDAEIVDPDPDQPPGGQPIH